MPVFVICIKFDDEVMKKKFDSEVKWLRYGQKRQNRKFRPNAFNFHSIFIEFFEKALYECTEQKNIKNKNFTDGPFRYFKVKVTSFVFLERLVCYQKF